MCRVDADAAVGRFLHIISYSIVVHVTIAHQQVAKSFAKFFLFIFFCSHVHPKFIVSSVQNYIVLVPHFSYFNQISPFFFKIFQTDVENNFAIFLNWPLISMPSFTQRHFCLRFGSLVSRTMTIDI